MILPHTETWFSWFFRLVKLKSVANTVESHAIDGFVRVFAPPESKQNDLVMIGGRNSFDVNKPSIIRIQRWPDSLIALNTYESLFTESKMKTDGNTLDEISQQTLRYGAHFVKDDTEIDDPKVRIPLRDFHPRTQQFLRLLYDYHQQKTRQNFFSVEFEEGKKEFIIDIIKKINEDHDHKNELIRLLHSYKIDGDTLLFHPSGKPEANRREIFTRYLITYLEPLILDYDRFASSVEAHGGREAAPSGRISPT